MIEYKDVHKAFVKVEKGGARTVLNAVEGVDLVVQDHEFVCLIGPSGCGKTTLLKMTDGLVPLTQGEILLDGRAITGPGPERAMVFQTFALLPWRTVLANVEFGLQARGVKPDERREASSHFIEMVGLSGFEKHYPHELSGGMQQRVGLARALAVKPDVLLMDEPFGSLDEQTRRVLQEDLLRLWEEQRQTVVFVTHSMDEAVFLADRIVMMSPRPGKIMEVIDVALPRPRAQGEVRKSKEFAELTAYVWEQIRGYSQVQGDPVDNNDSGPSVKGALVGDL